jgi:hypothetical protein
VEEVAKWRLYETNEAAMLTLSCTKFGMWNSVPEWQNTIITEFSARVSKYSKQNVVPESGETLFCNQDSLVRVEEVA